MTQPSIKELQLLPEQAFKLYEDILAHRIDVTESTGMPLTMDTSSPEFTILTNQTVIMKSLRFIMMKLE